MSKFIVQLSNDLLCCLSSNGYYLNIIENDETAYRIDSEQKIIHFNQINLLRLNWITQPNTSTAKLVVLVNRKLQWSIYKILKKSEPVLLIWGRIPYSENQSFGSSNAVSNVEIVSVHQLGSRILFVTSSLQMYELILNEQLKHELEKQLLNLNTNAEIKPSRVHCVMIYPPKTQHYLASAFLPSLQTNYATHSLAVQSNQNKQEANIFVVFRQKCVNKSKDQPKLFESIYTLRFDTVEKVFSSGKQCILNIQNEIIGLYLLDQTSQRIMFQTSKQLYMWDNTANKIQFFSQNIFLANLTIFNSTKGMISYIGAVQQPSKINNPNKQTKFIKISVSKENKLTFQQIFRLGTNSTRPLLYFRNCTKEKESYLFYQNYSVSKVKNIDQELSKVAIFQDHSALIDFAQLLFMEPMSNILLVHKKTEFSQQKIIITNSFLEVNHSEYRHNLPLNNSKIKLLQLSNSKDKNILLSSPIIGSLFIRLVKSNQSRINITVNNDFKQLTGYECLWMSQTAKVVLNPHQILFSADPIKQSKYSSLSISKLFQNSTDYIERVVVFEKSQTYLLSLDDQIHVFEGVSEKNFKRKFIHCFPSYVKSLYKLNDVNVFAVELYEYHNEGLQYKKKCFNCVQLYVLKEDKIHLLDKIIYQKQFSNFQHVSFLSHINTVPHFFNFICGKLVIVSSQQTHRFNPEKVKVQMFQFPKPIKQKSLFQIIPIMNFSIQSQNNPENEFLFLSADNDSNRTSMFIGSFSKKLLLNSFQQIKFNYVTAITQNSFFGKKVLFATIQTETVTPLEKNVNMMIFTENNCSYLSFCSGKLFLSNFTENVQIFIHSLFGEIISTDLNDYKGLQKVKGPIRICRKLNSKIESKISFETGEQVLIYNNFELWYATNDEAHKKINLVSVYALMNNDFLQFRNNLSVQELDESQFIKIFSLKLPIVQVKYLSDSAIIALFEKRIVVLQIGQNNSLTVRQQIAFSKAKENLENHENLHGKNNDYSSIQIIELLDKSTQTDIFLKDVEGRLYQLCLDLESEKYQIKFDRNLEEDIVCVGKVAQWDQQKVSISLEKQSPDRSENQPLQLNQELIVKRDGQIYVKDLNTMKEKTQYI